MTQQDSKTTSSGLLDCIWVIVPAYNEQEVIGNVTRQLTTAYRNVVVVDDGSTDHTADFALCNGAIVCRHPVNLGQGAALQTGISYALRHNAEVIVTFDADGQHQVSDIAPMVRALEQNNVSVALGSRFMGDAVNLSPFRRLILRAAIVFTRLTAGLKVTDAHNGLRAFRADAAQRIRISQNRMAHASEIVEQIGRLNLRYVEVPVTIVYTEYSVRKGQSSLDIVKILIDLVAQRIST
jgi:polyprenyl-phospho-N-acetylgalactosaminyl synthase